MCGQGIKGETFVSAAAALARAASTKEYGSIPVLNRICSVCFFHTLAFGGHTLRDHLSKVTVTRYEITFRRFGFGL
jgi:hypothetical protein